MRQRWPWWVMMLGTAGVEFSCAAQLSGFWHGFALVLGGAGLGAAGVMVGVDLADRRAP